MYIPLTFEGALQKCLFASGGYEGYFISGSQQWKYHWFTGSASLQVQKGTIDNVQIYVIGGGGGGGNRNTARGAGGGGGGGVNYNMNARLFQGTYSIVVGKGGASQSTSNSDGFAGSLSSFIGSNLSMTATGGSGGIGLNASTGGTGGSPNGGNGGSGGTSTAGTGSTGVVIYLNGTGWGFGCGGGGAEDVFNGVTTGFSCNGTQYGTGGSQSSDSSDGAMYYGMGGGAGNGSRIGRAGGSGSVLIQYPIYDYCNNYFDETGSCGCVELTFSSTDTGGYYPDVTGSYIYLPCGANQFVSGSLKAYAPKTVCAVSNSFYTYDYRDAVNFNVLYVYQGFANADFGNTKQCATQSVSPITCSVEWFPPTCTSSVVSVYTPSASVSNPNGFYYVPKNATSHSVVTQTTNGIKYYCISTGSLYEGNQIYPQVLTGNFITLYNTASCNTITINSYTGNYRGIVTYCNGSQDTLINPAPGSKFCIDTTIGVKTVSGYFLWPYSVGGNCLSGSFDTSSCGCP